MTRLLYTGNFPELQAKFIAEVSAQRKSDPLAPLDVVVSGKLLRLALRRDLARDGGSHANVRFWTLGELVRHVTSPLIRERDLHPLPDVARGPLMLTAIEHCGRLRYFNKIAHRPGFHRALWRTLGEMRGAGITHEQVHRAVRKLRSPIHETLQLKLTDILSVWDALDRLMRDNKLADSHDLLELAAQYAEPDPRTPIILYGLHDLTVLERRFVERVIRDRECAVYLPYRPDATHAWVKPLYQYFTQLGFPDQPLAPQPIADAPALTRTREKLFEEPTPLEKEAAEEDRSLLILSAPSRERETEEILREVLYSPLSQDVPRRRIGILLRESEPYTRLLRDELARTGVTGYVGRALGDTVAGPALRLFIPLLNKEFRRTEVMEFLLSSPVRFPVSFGGDNTPLPAAEWNHFSLLAGISSGEATWADALRRLRNQLTREQELAEHDDGDTAAGSGRISSLDRMSDFLARLFAEVRSLNAKRTWTERTRALWTLFSELIDADEDATEIAEQLRQVDALDILRDAPLAEHFAAAVCSILSAHAEYKDRFQEHEPTVVTYTSALGVLFDEVLVPGVVEKEIPHGAAQDPLLLDEDRRNLDKLHILSLPTREREPDRERFLFHSALSSARRRVVLSYPRREAGQSRQRLASSFLLNAAEVLTGIPTDYERLDRLIRETSFGRYIAADRLHMSSSQGATTELQYDIARLGEALKHHTNAPIADLLVDRPFFTRAIEAEEYRFRRYEFSRYDGLMEDASLRQELAAHWNLVSPVMSATRFERYASCPFQFFMLHVLGVEKLEEPSDVRELSPLERGYIMHDILEHFYRSERDSGRLPLQHDADERLHEIAERVFRRFARENLPGPPLLWNIEKRRILSVLLNYVSQERTEETRYVPAHFEIRYGMPGGSPPSNDTPLAIVLGDGREIAFRGRIDRIDVDPDGPARVIDYKSGHQSTGLANGRLCSGRALQLPLYRLAAEMLLCSRVPVAEYRYLSPEGKYKSVRYTEDDWRDGRVEFMLAVTTIHGGIQDGRYFPIPDEQRCSHCPVRTACGSGRLTFKWKEPATETASFRAMQEQVA
ncbi:PD-(D/E)XK nuclease family protein [bacterium]|nr:PD-(D/E)XK nuclease family protein [bacterium]MBU1985057.1 PD-(D/E)XK nuclease family protein [bacterium]